MFDDNESMHISHRFSCDLEEIRSDTMEMGGRVERQVSDAVKAMINLDIPLAQDVIDEDKLVNDAHIIIDDECEKIIALRFPAARDLRLVLTITKVINDLERVGDESKGIAKHAISLSDGKETHGFVEVRHIGGHVAKMLHDALDAFSRLDLELALSVAKEDKQVDIEYGSALREMISLMMEDPRNIKRTMNVVWAFRSLERIGDHARNIAEHVVYLVKGKDVRHAKLSEIEASVLEDK